MVADPRATTASRGTMAVVVKVEAPSSSPSDNGGGGGEGPGHKGTRKQRKSTRVLTGGREGAREQAMAGEWEHASGGQAEGSMQAAASEQEGARERAMTGGRERASASKWKGTREQRMTICDRQRSSAANGRWAEEQ
uniref:Uncharacterized protein n=1 Tax=Oryza punctata TaxID=4537 RepID=A0A0E0MKY6_ORYPU